SDPQSGKGLSRSAGHDQLATVAIPEPSNDIPDSDTLVRPWSLRRKLRGLFSDTLWPFHFGGKELTAQDVANRLFLAGDRILGVATDVIGCGDDEAIIKLRPVRFREKRIELPLRNRALRANGLSLDGPKLAIHSFGNQIDPFVRAPASGPIVPETTVLEDAFVLGRI